MQSMHSNFSSNWASASYTAFYFPVFYLGTELERRMPSILQNPVMLSITEECFQPFLIVSGQIAVNKKIEFEHTFRIGFSSFSNECLSKNLSEDRNKEGLYYFFSLWPNDESLKIFLGSMEFQLLNGAFHALGNISQTLSGNIVRPKPLSQPSFS